MKSSGEIGWTEVYDPSCLPPQTLPIDSRNPLAPQKVVDNPND